MAAILPTDERLVLGFQSLTGSSQPLLEAAPRLTSRQAVEVLERAAGMADAEQAHRLADAALLALLLGQGENRVVSAWLRVRREGGR